MKQYNELEIFRLLLENNANIMRSLALVLESRHVALYKASEEIRSLARINENVVEGLKSSNNSGQSNE